MNCMGRPSLRLKATKEGRRKLCRPKRAPWASGLPSTCSANSALPTTMYSMAPRAWARQPRKGCCKAVTQPRTWPSRSHWTVNSWSSVMISTARPARASGPRAGRAQVAMLSALMAMGMPSCSRGPEARLGVSSRSSRSRSARSRRCILVCLSSSWPARVGLTGRLRTTKTVPVCDSRARRRCETADWVMDRRCAARSKPPSSMMEARHSRASGSKLLMRALLRYTGQGQNYRFISIKSNSSATY